MYMPKVGEECFMSWHGDAKEYKVTITYIGDEVGCYKTIKGDGNIMEYTFSMDSVSFRPLKSKRDEEIESMLDCSSVSNYATCAALYDLGYRKQLPHSQFVSIIQCYFVNLGYLDTTALCYAIELANLLGRVEDTE